MTMFQEVSDSEEVYVVACLLFVMVNEAHLVASQCYGESQPGSRMSCLASQVWMSTRKVHANHANAGLPEAGLLQI